MFHILEASEIIITSFLLPPSYIVAPIGNLVNKQFSLLNFSFPTTTNLQASSLLTMFPLNNIEMDSLPGPIPNNHTKVRGRNLSTNRNASRDLSMSSTMSSVVYHEKMANNGMDVNEEPVVSTPALSYETKQEKAIHISKVAEQQGNMSVIRQKCGQTLVGTVVRHI